MGNRENYKRIGALMKQAGMVSYPSFGKIAARYAERDEAVEEANEAAAQAAISENSRLSEALAQVAETHSAQQAAENETYADALERKTKELQDDVDAKQEAYDTLKEAEDAAKAAMESAETEEEWVAAAEAYAACADACSTAKRHLAWAKEKKKLVLRGMAFHHEMRLSAITDAWNAATESERKTSSKNLYAIKTECEDAKADAYDSARIDVKELASKENLADGFTKYASLELCDFEGESADAYAANVLDFLLSDKNHKGHGFWIADAQGAITREAPENHRAELLLEDDVKRLYADAERMTMTWTSAALPIRSGFHETSKWKTQSGSEGGSEMDRPDQQANFGEYQNANVTDTLGWTNDTGLAAYSAWWRYDYANIAYATYYGKNGSRKVAATPPKPRTQYDTYTRITADSVKYKISVANCYQTGRIKAVRADFVLSAATWVMAARMDGRWELDEDQGTYPEEQYWGEYVHLVDKFGDPIDKQTERREVQRELCDIGFQRVSFSFKERNEKKVAEYETAWEKANTELTKSRNKEREEVASIDSSWSTTVENLKKAELGVRHAARKTIIEFRNERLAEALDACRPTDRSANDAVEKIIRMDWLEPDARDAKIIEQMDAAYEAASEPNAHAQKLIRDKQRELNNEINKAVDAVKDARSKWTKARAQRINSGSAEREQIVKNFYADLASIPRTLETWEATVQPLPFPQADAPQAESCGMTQSSHVISMRNLVVEYEHRTLLGFDIGEYDDDDPDDWGKAYEPPA